MTHTRPTALTEAVEAALHTRPCDGCDTTEPVIWMIFQPCACRFPVCVSCALILRRAWSRPEWAKGGQCKTCLQTITKIRWEAL